MFSGLAEYNLKIQASTSLVDFLQLLNMYVIFLVIAEINVKIFIFLLRI